MSKEYLPINIYKVSVWENDWIVWRTKEDVAYYYIKTWWEAPPMKDIRIQKSWYLWESIEDETHFHDILSKHKTLEVKEDKRNWLMCAYKRWFEDIRNSIPNDETFEPHLIASTAI